MIEFELENLLNRVYGASKVQQTKDELWCGSIFCALLILNNEDQDSQV